MPRILATEQALQLRHGINREGRVRSHVIRKSVKLVNSIG